MSQVLQPKSENKWYGGGAHLLVSIVYSFRTALGDSLYLYTCDIEFMFNQFASNDKAILCLLLLKFPLAVIGK